MPLALENCVRVFSAQARNFSIYFIYLFLYLLYLSAWASLASGGRARGMGFLFPRSRPPKSAPSIGKLRFSVLRPEFI